NDLYESDLFDKRFIRDLINSMIIVTSENISIDELDKKMEKEYLDDLQEIKFFIENKSSDKTYTNTKHKTIEAFKSSQKDYCNIELDFIHDSKNIYTKTINDKKQTASVNKMNFISPYRDRMLINISIPAEPVRNEFMTLDYKDSNLSGYYEEFNYCKNDLVNLIPIIISSLIISIVALVLYILNKANLFKKENSLYNKIPLEFHLGIMALGVFDLTLNNKYDQIYYYYGYQISFIIKFIFLLELFMLIHNFRTLNDKKDIIKSSLIIKCFENVKYMIISFKKYRKNTPLITRIIIIGVLSIISIGLVMLFLYRSWYWGGRLTAIVSVLLPSILIFIIVTYVIKSLIYLNKIMEGAQQIKNGKVDYKIEIKGNDNFTSLAEDINNISEWLDKAIDEKLKSERMKSELITNVSHDLKTPLTAIINYVGLIKKEENIQPEYINDYVNILDNKSKRLKVLIDDLFEASKASSGNISLNIEKLDLNQLLKQSIGENEEKLLNAKLNLKTNLPKQPVHINCDGKRMYRVFENLLSNISKYSLENTRVYIEIKEIDDNVHVYMKNISAYELNFEVDEITERFKRGDLSRNTEGSGLGLAIAKDLVQLQNGSFDIQIDADLFKVEMVFTRA
ncbi:MAG: HAMP domain-containing sensor histidine kinase, partial [Romboutsia sp.]|uniref:HAMP domain-containing sensor histidine kinase n=1 Tax=Romboutsia sp. TaxID=1965302 RepID=UPI003F3C5CEE